LEAEKRCDSGTEYDTDEDEALQENINTNIEKAIDEDLCTGIGLL
jgi:hypothetical protein